MNSLFFLKPKYFLIFIAALVLLFLNAFSANAACSNVGEHCQPETCCSGLECTYHKCHLPVGSSCGNCCGDCGFIHCVSGKCCGAHAYPTNNENDCCPGYYLSGDKGWCTATPTCTSHDYSACYDNDRYWYNSCDTREEKREECGSDSCGSWSNCGCLDTRYIKECADCIDKGCSADACFSSPYADTRQGTDCDASDTCIGTTFRDFSCSGGSCVSVDKTCDSHCANPPDVPTLTAPPHNTWINEDPIFKAGVSDPDGENVRAQFNVSGYGSNWGNVVNSGEISQWGPVNLGGACKEYWWQARAEDTCGLRSNWSGWWRVRVDKDLPPNPSISYPTGNINYATFKVALSESDSCSGVKEGDVDISIDGSAWKNHLATINDFNYTGSVNHCYKFRYRIQDNAGNWSGWVEDGEVCVDTSVPTCSINHLNGWINSTDFNVTLIENDEGGSGISQGDVDIQNKHKDGTWPIWSDYSNTIDDFQYTGQHCYFYKFRYKVQDSAKNWSDWCDPGYITKIDTVKPVANINYPSGTLYSTSITVGLTESDDCSEIQGGDVDIKIDGGNWDHYKNTIDDFDFIGSYGHNYQFRYRTKDNAGNWSDFVEGEIVSFKALPEANPLGVDWFFCPELKLKLTWSYSDLNNFPQIAFQIQINNTKDFSSPMIDTGEISGSQAQYYLIEKDAPELSNGTSYYWQIKVKNSNGDWSPWKTDYNLLIFLKTLETYSTAGAYE